MATCSPRSPWRRSSRHVTPARRSRSSARRRGLEQRLVPAAGYPLRTLPLSGLKGRRGLLASRGDRAAAGVAAGRCLVWLLPRRARRSSIGVGGYASGPAVLAAWAAAAAHDGARAEPLAWRDEPLARATGRRGVRALRLRRASVSGAIGIVTGNPVRAEFARDRRSAGRAHARACSSSAGAVARVRSTGRWWRRSPSSRPLGAAPRIVHQTGAGRPGVGARGRTRAYPAGRYEVARRSRRHAAAPGRGRPRGLPRRCDHPRRAGGRRSAGDPRPLPVRRRRPPAAQRRGLCGRRGRPWSSAMRTCPDRRSSRRSGIWRTTARAWRRWVARPARSGDPRRPPRSSKSPTHLLDRRAPEERDVP